jgi:hypothetical protein
LPKLDHSPKNSIAEHQANQVALPILHDKWDFEISLGGFWQIPGRIGWF